jgi:hypothetical protein
MSIQTKLLSNGNNIKRRTQEESIPFYISPIHHPSTNPRFLSLEEGDLAPWLTVEEAASNSAILEIWYEETDSKWHKANLAGIGLMDLNQFRRLEKDTKLGDNAILITLSTDPRSTYYLDPSSRPDESGRKRSNTDAVERSRRETRMKKGIGLGGLHQCVLVSP